MAVTIAWIESYSMGTAHGCALRVDFEVGGDGCTIHRAPNSVWGVKTSGPSINGNPAAICSSPMAASGRLSRPCGRWSNGSWRCCEAWKLAGSATRPGKVCQKKIKGTHRYLAAADGLRTIMAVVVLREKILKPLLTGTVSRRNGHPPENRDPLDKHYQIIRDEMEEILQELKIAA